MHAWVSYTSADTHCCRLRQETLDLLPGVFQVQTLRHKLQRLERVVFVRSLNLYLHNCPKRAPCSSLCGFEALTLQVDSKCSPHTAKETNQEGFRQAGASWAKKPRQRRHNAQRVPLTLVWLHDLILSVPDYCSDLATTPPGRDRSLTCSRPSLTVAAKWNWVN